MIRVLGIDVASSTWTSNGSALLTFQPGAGAFSGLRAPAIKWPGAPLSAAALADAIDDFVRQEGVAAVALDGPQGWRDPETPAGLPGVGRRCEYECRTQAKTGVHPITFPRNQRPWVEFSIQVFAHLLKKPGVRLADAESITPPDQGYLILECFPTSLWRTSGLIPLPGKSTRPELEPYAKALFAAYGLPSLSSTQSHDDLQAVVAAIAAAALVGGPAIPVPRGTREIIRHINGEAILTEGYIWDARPHVFKTPVSAVVIADPPVHAESSRRSRIRVTQKVLDHVARTGRAQAQIALDGFPPGTKTERPAVTVILGDERHHLIVADSHAAWSAHQTDEASVGFDRLFARLSDAPDAWVNVRVEEWHRNKVSSPTDQLASHGRPKPDSSSRMVSIPVQIVNGKVEGFGKQLPVLKDCIGDLIVPAFAVRHVGDLEWLTGEESRLVLEADTPLLARVSGSQVPPTLLKKCRAERVRDSLLPGAFVEFFLVDPLYLRIRGTKTPTLEPAACVVPVLDALQVESVNEAYRRISEAFEPDRRSYGGNVFRGCYYFDAEDERWHPLGKLRGDVDS